MDTRFAKNGGDFRKVVTFMDDHALAREEEHDERYAGYPSSAGPLKHSNNDQSTEVAIQMALHPISAPVQVQTCVSGGQTISATIVVGAHQDRRRVSSHHIRSRSKTPPLPTSLPPAFTRYSSRSQTFAKREPSGTKYPCFGQPTAIGVSRRTTRVSSMVLTDGMKSLTLEDYDEDKMDYTWG